MPYRRPGTPFYWISYTDASGRRVRESSGTSDRQEAAALEGGRKADVHRVGKWGEPQPRTVDEVLLQYLKDTPKKKSHERDLFSADRLQAHWSGRNVHGLSAGDVRAYKDWRTTKSDTNPRAVKEGTIARELGLLSAAIGHVNAELGWGLPNPTTDRIPQPKKKAPRWLTPAEARVLIQTAMRLKRAPHLVDFIELGLATGMRRDEMLRLEWNRVDVERRMIYFGEDDQKKGVPGSIPLNDGAIAVLTRRLAYHRRKHPNSPWVFVNQFGKRLGSVKTAFREAAKDLRAVTPHTLRHTFASWLVQAAVPLRVVCELCRHEDIRTTMRYAHLAPHSAAAFVGAIDGMLAEAGSTVTGMCPTATPPVSAHVTGCHEPSGALVATA